MDTNVGGIGDSNSHPSEEVRLTIENYVPRVAPEHWSRVSNFVRQTTLLVSPPSPGAARQVMIAILRLAVWGWATLGLPATTQDLFSREVIERYVRVGLPAKEYYRHRELLLLFRINAAIGGERHTVAGPSVPAPSSPYNQKDSIWIRTWAAQQHTRAHRQAANAMLGFCRGAGLGPKELLQLRARDVKSDSDGLRVHVPGGRSRIVPVHPRWSNNAMASLEDCHPDQWIVFPTQMSLRDGQGLGSSRFIGRTPKLTSLREAWIAELLPLVPVTHLQYAAGFRTLASLENFLKRAGTPSSDSSVAALRAAWGDR